MLKFIWHWAVVAPADVVAKLTAIAVTALPLVAAVATWILVRSLFDGGGRAKQTAVVTYAWIAAIYVAVIGVVSTEKVPKAIFIFLHADD